MHSAPGTATAGKRLPPPTQAASLRVGRRCSRPPTASPTDRAPESRTGTILDQSSCRCPHRSAQWAPSAPSRRPSDDLRPVVVIRSVRTTGSGQVSARLWVQRERRRGITRSAATKSRGAGHGQRRSVVVRTMSLVRLLAFVAAVCFIAATLLFLGLTLNLFVPNPQFPDSADLPTRLLGSIEARHASWPFDFVSALLFGAAFSAIALLGRLLTLVGPLGDGRLNPPGSALFCGGLLGLVSQLIHIRSQQVAIDVPYCDCGYKVQETISQYCGLTLIQGAESWLVNGATVFLAIGIALAGAALAGVVRSPGWRFVSWLTVVVAIISVVMSGLELGGDVDQLLVAVLGGILLPLWAVLLARGIGPTARAQPETPIGEPPAA